MNDGCDKKQAEAYLLNRLSPEEETLFQMHLATCESCRGYVQKVRTLATVLKADEEDEESVKEEKEKKGRKIPFGRYWLSVAACVLILVGISTLWHTTRQAEGMKYAVSVEENRRASQAKIPVRLLQPEQKMSLSGTEHVVQFEWNISCPYHLKVSYNETVLFETEGNGSEYALSTNMWTSYPHVNWKLTVDGEVYYGKIILKKD